MKSADSELAHLPYTGAGVAWPTGDQVDIDMSSPDATGAVAYYFDTLTPVDAPPSNHSVSWAGGGFAAASYLLGLVQSKGLQVARGPYLTQAPQSDLLPNGWQMVRALIWVEEFDHPVPVGSADEHLISIQPASKMDSSGLFESVCSCGEYRSAPTSRSAAVKSGRQHQEAKADG